MLRHVEGAEAIAGSVEDVVVLAEVVHAVGVVAEEPRGADTRTRMVCCLSMSSLMSSLEGWRGCSREP